MSLRNRLILTTFAVSFVLSLITILIFALTAKHHLEENVQRVYKGVARTFTFVQKATAKSADDVLIELPECRVRKANTYIMLTERGLLIGRVEDCRFYGTDFRSIPEFTASVNELRWFIVYDRQVLERLSEGKPEFFDKFIGNRVVLNDFVVEGDYDPKIIREIYNSTGYKLTDRFRTLIMDFPVVVENSIPVGRVVFVKDFSSILKDVLFTPVIFLGYTLVLVVVLSSLLFLLFNRLVRDITMLKTMAYKFKELDFSDIPKLNEHVRKDKHRDELFSLKMSVLTMAQELEEYINQLKGDKEKFEELAYTDPLTGLNNRRFFMEKAKTIIDLSKRYGEPVALLMMDIDNFKRINDNYGHDVGDLVLKKLAEVINASIRSSDIPARFGGEEFVVLLPKTDEKGALMVAERIRNGFRNSSVQVNGKEVWTSVSIGLAMLEEDDDIDTLIKKADEALYEAKRSGKDRVVVFKHREEDQEQD
ncbi:GGDEF domain-containing protein [Hydrogenivirga sp.]